MVDDVCVGRGEEEGKEMRLLLSTGSLEGLLQQ